MTPRGQYAPGSADVAQFCRFCRLWSAHVDVLERHLSTDTWALAAVGVALITYPVARVVIPALLHAVVPDVVRTMLSLI